MAMLAIKAGGAGGKRRKRGKTETVDPHLASQDRVLTEEERLEEALQESMDGSDPPSITRPGNNDKPAPSSGFPE